MKFERSRTHALTSDQRENPKGHHQHGDQQIRDRQTHQEVIGDVLQPPLPRYGQADEYVARGGAQDQDQGQHGPPVVKAVDVHVGARSVRRLDLEIGVVQYPRHGEPSRTFAEGASFVGEQQKVLVTGVDHGLVRIRAIDRRQRRADHRSGRVASAILCLYAMLRIAGICVSALLVLILADRGCFVGSCTRRASRLQTDFFFVSGESQSLNSRSNK